MSGMQALGRANAGNNRTMLRVLAEHNPALARMLPMGKYLVLGPRNPESIATEVVHSLMSLGGEVAVTCFDEKTSGRMRDFFESVGVTAVLPCDVTDKAQIEHALRTLRDVHGWKQLNGIVHSIAFTKQFGSMLEADDEAIDAAVRVSALSFRTVIRTALAFDMLAPRSSSVALGYRAYARHPETEYDGPMFAAKAILRAEVGSLSQTLARNGKHRVNLVSPGPIPTKAAMGIPGFPEILKRFQKESPMGDEPITKENVADLVAFLMSEAGQNINNQDIAIDCGRD